MSEQCYADVIILGNTIPGAFAAHLLKEKLGEDCDVLVLDQKASNNELFKSKELESIVGSSKKRTQFKLRFENNSNKLTVEEILNKGSQRVLRKYEHFVGLDCVMPDFSVPENVEEKLKTVYLDEELNVICQTEQHNNFPYGGLLGRWEITQWFAELDSLGRRVPPAGVSIQSVSPVMRALERELDSMSVAQHVRMYVFVSTARTAVEELVWHTCGADPDKVSVLFYLWARKKNRIRHSSGLKLVKSDSHKIIALRSKNERITIDTDQKKGQFQCRILVIALKPSQLSEIQIDQELLSEGDDVEILSRTFHGIRRSFSAEYSEPFWRENGYSGEMFSLAGPIRSTNECTFCTMSMKNCEEVDTTPKKKSDTFVIVGNLRRAGDDENSNNMDTNEKDKVLAQLCKCFGRAALSLLKYRTEEHAYIEIPAMGDFTGLLKLQMFDGKLRKIDWSCLDLYNDCDLDTALISGYKAYVNVLYALRPQAVTFEDLTTIMPYVNITGRTLEEILWWHVARIRRNMGLKSVSVALLASVLAFAAYSYLKTGNLFWNK